MAVNQPAKKPSGAQPGAWVDPYRAYNFKLLIQGVTAGHFTSCSGLGIRVQPIRYREGGSNQVVHAIPGQVEYSDVTLHYGVTDSHSLFQWMLTAVKGDVQRKNVSILLLDSAGGKEVTRWNLMRAWPTQWLGAPLDALEKQVAIESLTLVYESLELA
jgi:phage tail-like protein